MIGLVDYGAGNLFSVRTALERIGREAKRVSSPSDLDRVDQLLLPGVGHFGAAAERLRASGLFGPLRTWAESGRPLLGICLGMQLMFEASEEDAGRNPGLGIFRGRVVRLRGPRRLHMGWNAVGPDLFYFVHGYFARTERPEDVLCESRFGDACFPSVAGQGPILGAQFHPEKSGAAGLAFLSRWADGRANIRSPAILRAGSNPLPSVRIIPCLDMDDGRVVKGVRFEKLRDAGDPVERARQYDRQGADELCFLDVGATGKSRRILLEIVRRVSREIFIPLTVGGGLRSVEDIRDVLRAGADKVSLGTAAVENPELVREASERFGRQCIVVSIDAKIGTDGWRVTTHGGRRDHSLDAVAWAASAEAAGAGEILLNAVDRDGTGSGYDLELLRRVRAAVTIPVIASGGARDPEHALSAVAQGGADAVLLASALHDGLRTISEFKCHLRAKGVFIR